MESENKTIVWYNAVRGRLLFCFLSGAVFALPCLAEWAFALTYAACAVFVWLLLEGTLCGKEFRACLCFCLGMQWVSCAGLAAMYPLPYFGFAKPIAFLLVCACCLVLPACYALIMASVLQLSRFLPSKPIVRALGLGALWVVAEWVLTVGDMAFPWGTVALLQTGCLPVLQTVSLLGTGAPAFVTVTVCALIAQAFLYGRRSLLIAGSATLAGVFALGGVLLALPVRTSETLPVAAVQGNISADSKWDENSLPATFETYLSLTERAAKAGASLILLPESAVPVQFTQGGVLHEAFGELARTYDCTIVLGVLRYENDALYNSLVAISPDGALSDFYNKRHAVPFGEKTPFDAVLPDLCPGTDLTVGNSASFIETDMLRMGCLICFDSVFAGEKIASDHTDLLLLATNDAWFGDGASAKQHLRHAKLRAVESGKPLLRAGNTGISAVIDRNGRVITQSGLSVQTVLHGDLTLTQSGTLYAHIGEIFPFAAGVFALLCIMIGIFEGRKGTRHAG